MKLTLKPPFIKSTKHKKKRPESPSCGSTTSSSSSLDTTTYHNQTSTPRSVLSDHEITRQELEILLRRLAASDDEVAAMLSEAGSASGRITMAEVAARGGVGGPKEAEMREAFEVFDADGDGKISAEELRGMFVMLGDEGCSIEDCRRMIGGVDSDCDGFVGFHDFVRMMDGQI